ncbi:MAG: hypothetical protein ABI651_05595, partial [Verrucomicrobiota bacterium]
SNGENPSVDQVLAEMASIFGCRRDRLRLPLWLWRILGAFCCEMSKLAVLPHAAHTLFWRLSHMILDGVCADASKLNAVLHPTYQPYEECLKTIYGKNRLTENSATTDLPGHPVESSGRTTP